MLRLAELRDQLHISMKFVSHLLDIPYTTYVSYEKGDREPNSEMLITLANFFNVSIDYLIGRSDNPYYIDSLNKAIADASTDEERKKAYAKKKDAILSYGPYEEEVPASEEDNSISPDEYEMIVKYRTLDKRGKRVVSAVLKEEYSACRKKKKG